MVPFFFSNKVRHFRMGLLVRLWAGQEASNVHPMSKPAGTRANTRA